MFKTTRTSEKGFTIVELLIVIVVIAILAAITIVAYNGIQERARKSNVSSDISTLTKAIIAARISTEGTLAKVTGASSSKVTADACNQKATGTDLAALPRTDNCWSTYLATLDAISNVGNVNVRNLVDPWGRPYFIYEQEGRMTPDSCMKDQIGMFSRPFFQWGADWGSIVNLPNSLSDC